MKAAAVNLGILALSWPARFITHREHEFLKDIQADVEQYEAAGDFTIARHDLITAAENYEKALAVDHDPKIVLTLAWIYRELGRYRRAEALCCEAIALCRAQHENKRSLASLQCSLGFTYAEMYDFAQSLTAFEEARDNGGEVSSLQKRICPSCLSAG
jgi:tetratricopeptide (TPR) repeat protein